MTENTNITPFEKRCEILADLWLNYSNDEAFADFVAYNDLGLPLAYLLDNKIVETTDRASGFVNEAWDLFLSGLSLEDIGYDSLNDLLDLE